MLHEVGLGEGEWGVSVGVSGGGIGVTGVQWRFLIICPVLGVFVDMLMMAICRYVDMSMSIICVCVCVTTRLIVCWRVCAEFRYNYRVAAVL